MATKSSIFENRYFATYAVASEAQALWLSKKPVFAIIGILWEAGPKGLTQKQISKRLEEERIHVKRSAVYATLKALREQEIVFADDWDEAENAHRIVLRVRWLPAELDEDFDEWIDENLGADIEKNLFPVFLEFMEKVMERARKKDIPLQFIPKQSEDGWCLRCDLSHEAQYFFLGLLYSAASSFVFSPLPRKEGGWPFKNEELRKSIEGLFVNNKLAREDLAGERA
jgi:hypothetical protein